MKTPATLQRPLQALFKTGISIFALAPVCSADTVEVAADNYDPAESDFQIKDYIEKLNCCGKFHHSRQP